MIKVIDNSPRRMLVRLRGRGMKAGMCILDREKNAADVARSAFLVPFRRTRIALSEVTRVVVKHDDHRQTYHPVLELEAGKGVSLGGYAKHDAMKAAKAIRTFLEMK